MEKKYNFILIFSLIFFLILCGIAVYFKDIPPDNYLYFVINQKLAIETLDPLFIFGARVLVYIPMIPAALLFLKGDKDTKKIIILMFLAVFISRFVFDGLKHVIGRIRPYDYIENARLIVDKQDNNSFPSGHSSVASVLTTFAIYYIKDNKLWAKYLMIIYLVLVGYSRVYVGVHYPLDIFGGLLLGISMSLGLIALYEYRFIGEKA